MSDLFKSLLYFREKFKEKNGFEIIVSAFQWVKQVVSVQDNTTLACCSYSLVQEQQLKPSSDQQIIYQ